MAEKTKNDKLNVGQIVIAALVVLVVIPLLIAVALYFALPVFKESVNQVMSQAPAPIGSFFEKMPTQGEVDQKIKDVADFMLTVDNQRAIDKLIILKKSDPASYDKVIMQMIRINPNVTKNILEGIRQSAMQKDAMQTALDQLSKDQETANQKQADFLKSLTVQTALEEINKLLRASVNGHKNVAGIISKMDPIVAGNIMKYLSPDDYSRIMQYMPMDKATAVKSSLATSKDRLIELKNAADIYASEDNQKLATILGDGKTYTNQELPILFKQLGPLKGGQVLAKMEDQNLVSSILSGLKENEILDTGVDNLTKDYVKSLKIFKGYDDNVNMLAGIYEKMDTAKVAPIISQMMKNVSQPKTFSLSSGENIIISDETLAIDLMKKFSAKKKGEILQSLDQFTSTELAKRLALP